MKKAFFFCCLLMACGATKAQVPDSLLKPPAGGNPIPSEMEVTSSTAQSVLQNTEFLTSFIILIVGVLILSIVVFAKPLQRLNSDQHIKLIIVVLTVVASLFLIAYGFNSEQTAPAFGLLGTILGYILGKGNNNEKGSSPT